MQIIIPMAGTGDRYQRAGYKEPKPLIPVDGIPLIYHVIDLFPGEENFLFICNNDHLSSTSLREILLKKCPKATIVGIDSHKKGPVYTVSKAFDQIDTDDEAIVNYCDFGAGWDYGDFKNTLKERKPDGAITAYKGFHPHSLGNTLYAYMRATPDNWMLEIKEKGHFTPNRMNEYASAGTYYFKHGRYVVEYFRELMDRNIHLNDEYYVSLVYNLLQEKNLKTSIYEIPFFLQWGTPDDLKEYQYWSDVFRYKSIEGPSTPCHDHNVMLMAGRGQRFQMEGYPVPKPFIPVDKKPMFLNALQHYPKANKNHLVCLEDHIHQYGLQKILKKENVEMDLYLLSELTQGQACTAYEFVKILPAKDSVFIGPCDNGMIWDEPSYRQLLKNSSADAVVWVFSGYPPMSRKPESYSWVKFTEDKIDKVSMKKPVSDSPQEDWAIVGAFSFLSAGVFTALVQKMMTEQRTFNNEYYIDDLINVYIEEGKKVVAFKIDRYLGWGTPNELKTYQYWSRYFKLYRS